MAALTGDYQFAAEPRTVKARKNKYRDEEETNPKVNIMFDKRVVRGNTYATMVVPASTQQEIERQQELERKHRVRMEKRENLVAQEAEREISTPEPVEGRKHYSAQTEAYIETLTEKPVEYEKEIQTDFYIDRPPTPLFLPRKEGEDVETQVEDGELFDFDLEVDPILEVLVGKVIEQGRMEVLEEEELRTMRDHQRFFEQKRNAELMEVQRLEAEEQRRKEEAERRKLQARARREQRNQAHKKYIARIISKRYLQHIGRNTIELLNSEGSYKDPRETNFHQKLLPWLYKQAQAQQRDSLLQLIEELFKKGVNNLLSEHKNSVDKEYQRREDQRQEAIRHQQQEEKRKQDRVQARIDRQKRREIEALRERVKQEIIEKSEKAEGISRQELSDIDGRNNVPIVGTPGGILGEFLCFIVSLEEVTGKQLTQEQLTQLLHDYVNKTMRVPKFKIDVLQEEKVETFKQENQLEFALNELFTAMPTTLEQVNSFILDRENWIPGTSLGVIWEHFAEFNLRENLFEQLLQAFFTVSTSKQLPEGGLNYIKEKLEIGTKNWTPDRKEVAVVRIRIPIVYPEPPPENTEEPKEPQEPQEPQEPPQPYEKEDLEDQVLMVNPTHDEFSVFVVHQAPQKYFRNEICNWVKTVKGYNDLDVEALKETMKAKGSQIEEKLLEIIANDLPVFDFEIN